MTPVYRRGPIVYHLPRRASPVKHLNLNNRRVDVAVLREAVEAFHKMPHLEHLSLSRNPFGDDGIQELAKHLHKLPHLRRLDLTEVKVESAGAFILLSALRKHPSESITVDLRYNHLGETAQDALATWAMKSSHKVLLSHNHPID